MNTLSRRRFLVASGVASGTALAAGAGAVSWADLRHQARENPLPSGARVLVLVTLYGGNDGLNTVIPYADGGYHGQRPQLAYAPADVLHLDASLGLNPAMTGLLGHWKAKRLAIVRGVGYPKPDHSHFRSMDIWQTASPERPVTSGWIGRWLDVAGADPMQALNIGSTLPPLAVGTKTVAAALPLGSVGPGDADASAGLAALSRSDSADTPAAAAVRASYRTERTVASTFAPVIDGGAAGEDSEAPAGSGGGQGELERQVQLGARCIKAGVPTRVYAVSLGGFDTHANERGTQQALLGTFDKALSAFLADMAGDPRGKGVVTLAYSEFGRRVAANASQGTDHGTAGPVFVAGAPVRGGFYGEQPSLTDLDNGDLKVTTDFRSVYSELLHRVLGADPASVLDKPQPELGFLA